MPTIKERLNKLSVLQLESNEPLLKAFHSYLVSVALERLSRQPSEIGPLVAAAREGLHAPLADYETAVKSALEGMEESGLLYIDPEGRWTARKSYKVAEQIATLKLAALDCLARCKPLLATV